MHLHTKFTNGLIVKLASVANIATHDAQLGENLRYITEDIKMSVWHEKIYQTLGCISPSSSNKGQSSGPNHSHFSIDLNGKCVRIFHYITM